MVKIRREKKREKMDKFQKAFMQGVSEKRRQAIMRKSLGMEFFEKKDQRKKEFEEVYEKNFDVIKKQLKSSIKKTYSQGIGEIVGRIELINELFQEFQATLKDLEGEDLSK